MNKLQIVLMIVVVLVLAGCTRKKEVKVDPFTVLPTLNHEQFQQKFNNDEEFFVYIGRYDCGDSDKFEAEFIEQFVNYDENDKTIYTVDYELDKKLYFFDISEIIDSTKSTEARNNYQKQYGFYYTPSLVHYKNGEVMHIAEWDPIFDFEFADYMKWFYETQLITPRTEVYHEGKSDHVINP